MTRHDALAAAPSDPVRRDAPAAGPEDGPPPLPRRRRDDPPAERGAWSVDTTELHAGPVTDPWVALVRTAIEAYGRGHGPARFPLWDPQLEWRVAGPSEAMAACQGAEAVEDYHAALADRTAGTYHQRVIALSASGGPMVQATIRTTARRGTRQLDQPGLLVFEIGGARVRRVTELPGDPVAWTAFWRD